LTIFEKPNKADEKINNLFTAGKLLLVHR